MEKSGQMFESIVPFISTVKSIWVKSVILISVWGAAGLNPEVEDATVQRLMKVINNLLLFQG